MIRWLNSLTRSGALRNIARDVRQGVNSGIKTHLNSAETSEIIKDAVETAVGKQSGKLVDQAINEAFNPKMSTVKKVVLGGGAVAGGVLGYNALTGNAANDRGMMAEAEAAGARAAIRDVMAGQGYGAPMTRIDAANSNYQGPLGEGMALTGGRA